MDMYCTCAVIEKLGYIYARCISGQEPKGAKILCHYDVWGGGGGGGGVRAMMFTTHTSLKSM